MRVAVKAWDASEALAIVADVRVRVRRYPQVVRWLCSACGSFDNTPACPHLAAFAATQVPGWPHPMRKD